MLCLVCDNKVTISWTYQPIFEDPSSKFLNKNVGLLLFYFSFNCDVLVALKTKLKPRYFSEEKGCENWKTKFTGSLKIVSFNFKIKKGQSWSEKKYLNDFLKPQQLTTLLVCKNILHISKGSTRPSIRPYPVEKTGSKGPSFTFSSGDPQTWETKISFFSSPSHCLAEINLHLGSGHLESWLLHCQRLIAKQWSC